MSSCNNSCALITISTVMFSHVSNLTMTAFCTSGASLSKVTFIGSDSVSTGTKEADSSSQRFSCIYSASHESRAGRGMPGLSSQTINL
ncbi:cell surface protein [Escherichia coli]|nr:cell surface protein [Escherichia coli]